MTEQRICPQCRRLCVKQSNGKFHCPFPECPNWRPVEGTATPPDRPCKYCGEQVFSDHPGAVCEKCIINPPEVTPSAPGETEPRTPEEAAKMVYWRKCSLCGDVDRDSLAKAIRAYAASESSSLRWQLEQIELDSHQTDVDLHTAHKENGELWEELQAARQRIAELEQHLNGKL